ncbi:hypothetical protein HUW51_23630 [Adhaeribacter swui]|uniref:Uncharacterized protein n=1 Tax=Adhaeribacter swui TaxID=2086471 RepID=A0A7G7GEG7_9BACT|nr:hypothetical protein [Adhaeribacter swui]QNF35551.1 hypothetical protein HUW51_23630 [Adhaeribacter swui]
MMCEDCFQELIYKFPTQQNFEDFENILQEKCTEGKISVLDMHKTDYLSAFDSNLYFECRTCKEVWILNTPDYAWRGFFLPVDKAIEYKKESNKLDEKRSIGCLIVLIIIAIAIIWNYLK